MKIYLRTNLFPPSHHHHVDVKSHQKGNHRRKIIEISLKLFGSVSFYECREDVQAFPVLDNRPINHITSDVLVNRRQTKVDAQIDDAVDQVEDMKKSQLFPFINVFNVMQCY